MRNTYGSTLSSAGERSLQGYTQYVSFNPEGLAILGEKSLPAETYRIPLEFAPQRNRLQYVKGMMDYRRKSGGINDGPYILNYLNRKRNVQKMRQRVLEEIQDRIYRDKYYIEDYNVKEASRHQGRSKSVISDHTSRHNSLSFQPIIEEEESQQQSEMDAPSLASQQNANQTSRRIRKTETIPAVVNMKHQKKTQKKFQQSKKTKKENDSWSQKSSDDDLLHGQNQTQDFSTQRRPKERTQKQSQLQSRKQPNKYSSRHSNTYKSEYRQNPKSQKSQQREQKLFSKYDQKQQSYNHSEFNDEPKAPDSQDEW